jgi:hypothetical protein
MLEGVSFNVLKSYDQIFEVVTTRGRKYRDSRVGCGGKRQKEKIKVLF